MVQKFKSCGETRKVPLLQACFQKALISKNNLEGLESVTYSLSHYHKNPKEKRTFALNGDFFNIHSAVKISSAKYQKNQGGPLETLKIFRKMSLSAEKIEKGPFSLVPFCILR